MPGAGCANVHLSCHCADLALVYGKGWALSPVRRVFWAFLASPVGLAEACLAAHKSGRRDLVRASASACRQAATLAWSPEVRISGIGRPSNSCGRVYCGYSSRESEKLSSVAGGELAHHAGQQPDAGVDQRQSGDFAARKHVIPDRNLLEPAGLDHPLVDRPRTGRRRSAVRARRRVPRPATGSMADPAGSSAGEADPGRCQRRRWHPPARRRAAPCRGRRRPGCRRRCGGGRWPRPGCPAPPAPTARTPAPCPPG